MKNPLIRADRYRTPIPLSTTQARQVVHRLLSRAGVVKRKLGRRYDVCVHSLRKYFRTQLTAQGVPADYVEYMMGHKISTYHDIEMKGGRVPKECLRSLRPQHKAEDPSQPHGDAERGGSSMGHGP